MSVCFIKVPDDVYFSLQDKYIISSMAILCIVCVWHAVVAKIFDQYGEETAHTADWIGLVVLGCIYLALNVGFLMYTQCVVSTLTLGPLWAKCYLTKHTMWSCMLCRSLHQH